jgi:hypothetical protein
MASSFDFDLTKELKAEQMTRTTLGLIREKLGLPHDEQSEDFEDPLGILSEDELQWCRNEADRRIKQAEEDRRDDSDDDSGDDSDGDSEDDLDDDSERLDAGDLHVRSQPTADDEYAELNSQAAAAEIGEAWLTLRREAGQ